MIVHFVVGKHAMPKILAKSRYNVVSFGLIIDVSNIVFSKSCFEPFIDDNNL